MPWAPDLPVCVSPTSTNNRAAFTAAAVIAGSIGSGTAFAAAIVSAYCREAGLPVRALPHDGQAPISSKAASSAASLAKGLATAGPGEAANLIGGAYTTTLPSEHRARHGVFYTPPALVGRLLDMAEVAGTNWRTARVLDPACGGGAFMVAAASRMAAALSGMPPALALHEIGQRLRGFELDPFGAWLAQAMLDAQLAELARQAGRPVPMMVEVRDSLDLHACDIGSFDLVVGNPPYGRVTLSPERRALFARSVYGHANLYGLFTDAALRWAAPDGGLVAYVTPTSMLSGLYHKNLRALLAKAPPAAVDLVADRSGVFEDVLQETMLAVYRRSDEKRVRGGGGTVGFLALDAERRAVTRSAGRFSLPESPEAPWLLPRKPDQVALARRMRTMPHRLADYGYGVSTGPLVWNRHKPQLQTAKSEGAHPIVWAEAVSADGCFVWRAERRGHAPWFATRLPRDKWLLVDRPCVLLQRTTAKEQARRLIAAELPEVFLREHGAVVVENHLNMIRPVVAAPAVTAVTISAFLNSAAADAAFRCINGSVAVSAFELEAMPVPSPTVMGKVTRLLARGAPKAEVEATIAVAYHDGIGAGIDAAAAA